MVTQARKDIDGAVKEWLDAYRGHERYLAATENLFGIFAGSWQGPRRFIAEAFSDFCEALLREHGLTRLGVAEVFPKQRLAKGE